VRHIGIAAFALMAVSLSASTRHVSDRVGGHRATGRRTRRRAVEHCRPTTSEGIRERTSPASGMSPSASSRSAPTGGDSLNLTLTLGEHDVLATALNGAKPQLNVYAAETVGSQPPLNRVVEFLHNCPHRTAYHRILQRLEQALVSRAHLLVDQGRLQALELGVRTSMAAHTGLDFVCERRPLGGLPSRVRIAAQGRARLGAGCAMPITKECVGRRRSE
jgi:hypothetical protein